MVKIKEIAQYLEHLAPLDYQESYDNSGLLIGNDQWEVKGVLVCLDCTEAVVDEAIEQNCNLIVAHHPIWFGPLKKLTGKNYVEKTLIKAIKNDIAIYAIHTNLDNIHTGVNRKLAEKLQLQKLQPLSPKPQTLSKLVTFVPTTHTSQVLEALHGAGAGTIGDYQSCSFVGRGTGSFKPGSDAKPFLGKAHQLEQVEEDRIEVVVPKPLQHQVVVSLKQAHPYQEVAFYLIPLENRNPDIGSGLIGWLENPLEPEQFLQHLRDTMGSPCIKYTDNNQQSVQKIAICGGAGSFLIKKAIQANCQAFVTSDVKYHEFFDAEHQLLLADIGHYESEVSTKELLSDILTKNFSTFAVRLSQKVTNPIRYF